eukprot:TRINITY_DN510_c0_g1_i3.p1 TRINITY_DN510_c0_g1~~TRINITY_DN510_c0_g1_i3.p1  ORF type:complete len:638 (+),score=110.52 TRINITY_DN510_c0_g1_i3:294-2207(+)
MLRHSGSAVPVLVSCGSAALRCAAGWPARRAAIAATKRARPMRASPASAMPSASPSERSCFLLAPSSAAVVSCRSAGTPWPANWCTVHSSAASKPGLPASGSADTLAAGALGCTPVTWRTTSMPKKARHATVVTAMMHASTAAASIAPPVISGLENTAARASASSSATDGTCWSGAGWPPCTGCGWRRCGCGDAGGVGSKCAGLAGLAAISARGVVSPPISKHAGTMARWARQFSALSRPAWFPHFPQTSPSAASLSANVYSDLMTRAANSGKPVIPLHVGDTYLEPIAGARAEAQQSAATARLHGYSPPVGEPRLVRAIQDKMQRRAQVSVPAESLQVTVGGTAGFTVIAAAVLDPGDDVLLLSPFWPLIRGIFASRGANAIQVPLFTELPEAGTGKAAGFDVEAYLERFVTPRTTAVYVNTPSNPTGRVLGAGHIDGLARFAKKHGLWVISDDAYLDIYYTSTPPAPLWAHPDLAERCLSNFTMSKGYGLAGSRVGWIHGPVSVMPVVRGAQTFLTYCASKPMQLGAAAALESGDAWQEEARTLYRAAGYKLADALGVARPEGSTFLFLDVRPFVQRGRVASAADLLGRLADRGVLCAPGSACGSSFEHYVRVCYTVVPPGDLDRAIAVFREILF